MGVPPVAGTSFHSFHDTPLNWDERDERDELMKKAWVPELAARFVLTETLLLFA
jgi:hypothetical protein